MPKKFIIQLSILKNPEIMKKQIYDCENTLAKIRSKTSSSDEASSVLNKFLIS